MEPIRDEGDRPPGLRRVITLRHAVAIYVSSLLGSGIFVIPGLAARIAGPASILSWVLLSAASYPFAYTFAKLSARRPESGGIYAFARDGIGLRAGAATAWLFLAWAVLGAPAATVAAASYLAFVFPLNRLDVFLIAAAILIAAFVVNYIGIRFTGRVQIATVAAILGALAIAVVASVPRISPANYTPFLPNGIPSIGTAAALIVWSYLGYENTSNVAEEFRDPERDFHRSVVISVFLISGLYLAVAFVTVGTGAYTVGGGATPFAAMMSDSFGPYAGTIVALLAVFVTFGTVNAYVAGMARVYYAAARDGVFPKALAKVDRRTGVPHNSLVFLIVLVLLSLSLFYFLEVDFVTAFLMASGAAIFTYVIGSVAGIRLLKEHGMRRILPWISLAVSVALLPFIGPLLVASLVIAGLGLLASRLLLRQRDAAKADADY
jgi:amino acid efflux transporter